jgi:hypothetical protein
MNAEKGCERRLSEEGCKEESSAEDTQSLLKPALKGNLDKLPLPSSTCQPTPAHPHGPAHSSQSPHSACWPQHTRQHQHTTLHTQQHTGHHPGGKGGWWPQPAQACNRIRTCLATLKTAGPVQTVFTQQTVPSQCCLTVCLHQQSHTHRQKAAVCSPSP